MDKRKDKQLIKHMALALCTHAHKKRGDKKVCPQKIQAGGGIDDGGGNERG